MNPALPPILMTTDPIGGVWTYTLELCRELPGCDIALASMGRALEPDQRAAVARLSHVELFESPLALEWMPDAWRDVARAGDWLWAIGERSGAGIVHLNQFSHGALPWRMPCLVVGHSCVYSWFQAVRHHRPGAAWQRYFSMVQRGLRGAARVSAPSRWMLDELRRTYGAFNAAEPIYNGRAASRFAPGAKEDFILTAGRLWDPAKNVAALAYAAADIPWPIYAAGDETGPDGARAPISGIQHLGRLDAGALSRWMSRAAIFCLPARYEPFGLSIVEAALSGCALIIGDIPSLREIWHDCAVFVPPEDAQAIGRAAAALIADAAWRRTLAERARARAENFTSARMAGAYLALYAAMLAHAERRSVPARRAEGRAPA